jgi:release factor glutamine methyltransferase
MQRPVVKNNHSRVIDIINWAEEYFSLNGFNNSRKEIEWLLEEILDCKKLDLYLRYDEELSAENLQTLHTWIDRRIEKEPLQYITGNCEFYGRNFLVNNDVFIPRPETETLINIALSVLDSVSNQKILDICTGSGCIAITLAKELNNPNISAIDISNKALNIATLNAKNHNVDINFEQINIFSDPYKNKLDMIVCNPPYIPINEMDTIMDDVKLYEPKIALTDGSDGLSFYKRINDLAPSIVVPGGHILLEVGLHQHPQFVKDILDVKLFSQIEIIPDLNGDPRILKALVN